MFDIFDNCQRDLIARKANELALASEERKAQRQAARKKKDKEADDTETFAEEDQHYDEQQKVSSTWFLFGCFHFKTH